MLFFICRLSHAEQLVLYLKTTELLSTALHTAMEQVKQGKLYPSATVKQGRSLFIQLKQKSLISLLFYFVHHPKAETIFLCISACTVVRRLNELYKSSVASCRSLSTHLEHFFSRKHRLMDQITSITAERLLFSHTVQMVGRKEGRQKLFH